jgi:uncharacterized membrane protein
MTTSGNSIGTPAALEPGVGSSYGNGWRQLWPHFLPLFLIGLIYFVLSSVIQVPSLMINGLLGSNETALVVASLILGVFSFFYSIFFIMPLGYGENFAYLKAARGEKVEVQDMFAVFKNYWNALGASLLVSIIVGIGLILLIVPGIIFACKLAFVPYLVVDKKMNVGKAIDTSWRMTNGYAGKVFLIGLLAIPIVIAGFICLGVGVIIACMWITLAEASLYHAVSLKRFGETASSTIPTQPVIPPGASPILPA